MMVVQEAQAALVVLQVLVVLPELVVLRELVVAGAHAHLPEVAHWAVGVEAMMTS